MRIAKQQCIYKHLDNNIHEFIIHESSRAAVDQMIERIYQIIMETSNDTASLYLIDNSQVDAVPLSYLARRIKELADNRPKDRKAGHIAIIYEGLIGDFANVLLRGAMSNKFRFFAPDKRHEAIEWLENL